MEDEAEERSRAGGRREQGGKQQGPVSLTLDVHEDVFPLILSPG